MEKVPVFWFLKCWTVWVGTVWVGTAFIFVCGWRISALGGLAFLFPRPKEPPVWDIIKDTRVLGRGAGNGGENAPPRPCERAGLGIGLGGRCFRGPGDPVTNPRASFSPNLHPTVPSILGWKLVADRQSGG